MRPFRLHQWIGMGLLGVSLVAGCRHAHHCDCCAGVESAEPKVVLEEPRMSPYSPIVTTAKPAISEPETKPAIQPAAAQEVKPDYECVLMTMVTPDGPAGSPIIGTICLTPAEAKAMGIRPGYTPGALAVPAHTHA